VSARSIVVAFLSSLPRDQPLLGGGGVTDLADLNAKPEWTQEDMRRYLNEAADHVEDWQGIPVPVNDIPLRLHDRHPMADLFRWIDERDLHSGEEREPLPALKCYGEDVREDDRVVNEWFSYRLNVTVLVVDRAGRRRHAKIPRAPDGSMDRLNFWLQTIGASDAWEESAERTAREKLRRMLTARQWRHYDLTGSFIETSKRSGLVYVFRRLRPTIALTGNEKWFRPNGGTMRCLAVLCMHPIGYYSESWAGCMTPSDDVIAHLEMMRGDEAYYWRCANQHEAWRAEAGL
jgi:hypothetical protein